MGKRGKDWRGVGIREGRDKDGDGVEDSMVELSCMVTRVVESGCDNLRAEVMM